MKFAKKLLCFILAMTICLSMAPMALAGNTKAKDDIVAAFYVYVMETDIHPVGHMWVYLENLTDKPMKVGLYTVPPYEGVSIGVFCRKDGLGIYYNVEAYTYGVYGMKNQMCLAEFITADKVEDISDALINYNNHWDPIFNCMYFAFSIWNSGCSAKNKLIHLVWPPFGTRQIKRRNYLLNEPMKSVPQNKTYRQVGSGKDAYLKPATLKSLGRI
ncbi:MAG: hypothetical protein IJW86_04185 [Clostridia bacterium]|nr:hypothetical protein [Clostridia bacterium]